jgi:hypothetical protein
MLLLAFNKEAGIPASSGKHEVYFITDDKVLFGFGMYTFKQC